MRRISSEPNMQNCGQVVSPRVRRSSVGYTSRGNTAIVIKDVQLISKGSTKTAAALPIPIGDMLAQPISDEMQSLIQTVGEEQIVESSYHVTGVQVEHCLQEYGMSLDDLMAPALDESNTSLNNVDGKQYRNQEMAFCLMTPLTDGVIEEEPEVSQFMASFLSKANQQIQERYESEIMDSESLEEDESLAAANHIRQQNTQRRRRKYWIAVGNIIAPRLITSEEDKFDQDLIQLKYCHEVCQNQCLDKNTIVLDEEDDEFCLLNYDGEKCLQPPNIYCGQD
eukprot:TRINITY_DN2332_c0_g2_i1.p1 TRINITY_DN2332_c0_g2~~TRINITY_DN2332_c0_g2_i1.p1  ORF type:complete len:318 (-),score=26.12 TRINITY_DN2332_c0_g2_i1:600-1442(-)